MPEPTESGTQTVRAFTCPSCGSTRVRRSAPKGLSEQLIRSFSPFHFYRCRDCGRRGRYLGRGLAGEERGHGGRSGRPIENRDIRAARRRKRRLWVAVVLSLGLGALAGLYLHSCQQRAEQYQPSPQ